MGRYDSLDEKARSDLDNADQDRAQEILEELEAMGDKVRNPSAFVIKALRQHPYARGLGGARAAVEQERENWTREPQKSSSSRIYDALDDKAKDALDALDPDRASEILDELEAKGS